MKDSQNEQSKVSNAQLNELERYIRSELDSIKAQVARFEEFVLSRLSDLRVSGSSKQSAEESSEPRSKPKRDASKKLDDKTGAGAPPKTTTLVFKAYSEAFRQRYSVEPVRNASVNAKIRNFVQRIGEKDAVEVAKFYVGFNDSFYIKHMHPIGIMLKDCETLHARWRSGNFVSSSQAQTMERTQANINASSKYLSKKYATGSGQPARNTAKLPFNR